MPLSRKSKTILWIGVPCLLIAAIVHWCTLHVHFSYNDKDKAATLSAQAGLINRFNTGAFDEIYDNADDSFKQSASRQQLLQGMQASHDRFGSVVEDTEATTSCFGGRVRLVRYLKTSNNQDLTELSEWLIKDGSARLVQIRWENGRMHATPGWTNSHAC